MKNYENNTYVAQRPTYGFDPTFQPPKQAYDILRELRRDVAAIF